MKKKYQVSISVPTKEDVFRIKGYEGVRVFDEENKNFYFWDKIQHKFVAELTNSIMDISSIDPVDEQGVPINAYPGDTAGVFVDNGPGENDGPLNYSLNRARIDGEALEYGNRFYLTVDDSTGEIDRPLNIERVGNDITIYLATDSEGELDSTVNILENVIALELAGFTFQANGMGNGVCNNGLERTQFSGGGDNEIIGTPGVNGKMLYSIDSTRVYMYIGQWIYWDFTVV